VTRVLVVEDSATILLLLKTRLEMAGYEVVTAANGAAALESVRDEQPDLVVMDVMLPAKSGMEVLAEMRGSGDETPVIVCTAHRDEADRSGAMAAGANDYILKPIDFEELFRKIESLVS
jgi:DNA-binding response OmpR family regulator